MVWGFPCGSAGKESACSVGNLGLIPGLRRAPGEGKGYPLQYSGLENSVSCIVLGVAKSQTRLKQLSTHASMSLLIKIGTVIINTFLNFILFFNQHIFASEKCLFIPVAWISVLQDSTNSWKAFSASCWLWKCIPCKRLLRCLKKW